MVFSILIFFLELGNGLSVCDVDKVRNSLLLEEIVLRCFGYWCL